MIIFVGRGSLLSVLLESLGLWQVPCQGRDYHISILRYAFGPTEYHFQGSGGDCRGSYRAIYGII